MKNVLITGATGFLGKYLVQEFIPYYHVFALGRNCAKKKQLESLGAKFIEGDFTDKSSCSEYFQDIDIVVHAGAYSTVWGEWEDFYNTNVVGTRNVAELCMEFNVSRLIYVSSPSIYTKNKDQMNIKEENVDKSNHLNYYIKSKIMSEKIVAQFHKRGLYTVMIRPRGLIGIGDTSLVPRLLSANKKIGIPLMRNGEIIVDITCVENVAFALRLCVDAKHVNGEVFNISNGEPMRFKEILIKFMKSIKENPSFLRLPFYVVYIISYVSEFVYKFFHLSGEPTLTRYTVCTLSFSQTLDISKAKKLLGYQPIKTLEEGILEYGKWYKENH